MKLDSPPAGFVARRLPRAWAWFRPKMERPLLDAWSKAGRELRLSEVARRHPQSRRFHGRQPVFAAPFPREGMLVVRTCAHGGWWGRLAGDLYRGPSRVLREIRAGERLLGMKIPTPRIEAVIFYPAGPFCRIEVVTRLVPESLDLVECLARRPAPGQRTKILLAVRKLLGQLGRCGVRHPDLNARNILLSPSPHGWIAHLLDVDAVSLEEPSRPSTDRANRNRLLRSLFKRSRLGELGCGEAEVTRIWRELFPRS